jgi:hypothetical protein
MMRSHRIRRAGLACTAAALLGLGAACSGNSGLGRNPIAAPADNVAELTVDFGAPGVRYLNGLFTTVTVCVPGTSDCRDIDHVLVDTGSAGLRVLKSVLTLSLPAATDDSGAVLAECTQFVDSFIWGPLAIADLRMAGEQANNLTIQVIDEMTYPVPSDCTGFSANTAQGLGSNGILGISTFLQDCGSACAEPVGAKSSNPGMYYACASTTVGGCQATAVPVSKQASNPVALFSQDNNGTIVELPSIPADGAPSVTGSLVFGIGTRENNALDGATVMRVSKWGGTFKTTYPANGNPALAFVDTGSNGIYFLDSNTTHIPTCSNPYSVFYCPGSTLNLSAKNQENSGVVTRTVNFSIASAAALLADRTNSAFANLGGPSIDPQSGTSLMGAYFDWGLPFYFGRNVFTALEDQSTPAGVGPLVAF